MKNWKPSNFAFGSAGHLPFATHNQSKKLTPKCHFFFINLYTFPTIQPTTSDLSSQKTKILKSGILKIEQNIVPSWFWDTRNKTSNIPGFAIASKRPTRPGRRRPITTWISVLCGTWCLLCTLVCEIHKNQTLDARCLYNHLPQIDSTPSEKAHRSLESPCLIKL